VILFCHLNLLFGLYFTACLEGETSSAYIIPLSDLDNAPIENAPIENAMERGPTHYKDAHESTAAY
jgi:hypothetical protein